jgi:hypothetical protein
MVPVDVDAKVVGQILLNVMVIDFMEFKPDDGDVFRAVVVGWMGGAKNLKLSPQQWAERHKFFVEGEEIMVRCRVNVKKDGTLGALTDPTVVIRSGKVVKEAAA